MLELKSLDTIAGADMGWLKAKHHFAIGRFGNPDHKPVGNLYVLNDDEVAPHTGFGMHSHTDVEIVTYVRAGVVSHKDSLGNEGRIETGDVQVISAGTGIQHAEHNPGDVPTKIFQLWLRPRVAGTLRVGARSAFRSLIAPATSSLWQADGERKAAWSSAAMQRYWVPLSLRVQ